VLIVLKNNQSCSKKHPAGEYNALDNGVEFYRNNGIHSTLLYTWNDLGRAKDVSETHLQKMYRKEV